MPEELTNLCSGTALQDETSAFSGFKYRVENLQSYMLQFTLRDAFFGAVGQILTDKA